MTEFTKTKMHFALALLGALFALHPFLERLAPPGLPLPYLEPKLEVLHVYSGIAGLLALSVYCFAVVLMSEHPSSWTERVGNVCYALAIMLVPLYGGLYVVHLLAVQLFGQEFVDSHLARAVPLAAIAISVGLALGLMWWFRQRLSEKDRAMKIKEFERHEHDSLRQSRELFDHQHYDLSIVEAWKAVEARLRRLLLHRGATRKFRTPQQLIDAARANGLLRESTLRLLHDLRMHWNVAVGVEPSSREAAESALTAARHVLACTATGHTRHGNHKETKQQA